MLSPQLSRTSPRVAVPVDSLRGPCMLSLIGDEGDTPPAGREVLCVAGSTVSRNLELHGDHLFLLTSVLYRIKSIFLLVSESVFCRASPLFT